MTVTAIVLAAGQGSRFRAEAGADQDKLLADCVGLDGVTRPVIELVADEFPAGAVTRVLARNTVSHSPERLFLPNDGYGVSLSFVGSGLSCLPVLETPCGPQ